MKISYNWLKQYIDIDLDHKEVAEILTNTGLEVEGIEEFQSVKGGLEGIVIGEVKTKEKHPDADKLSLTIVDIGRNENLKIVCGAPNVEPGQKVVVATVGTTLYQGNEAFKIKKTKIRGEVSEGMICAEDELGLGTSHDGIMVLEENVKVGTFAKDFFKIENDIIFEIGLTPNRIDGASHYGVARDLAAYLKQSENIKLQKPSVKEFKIDDESNIIDVIVENEEACPRYSGITISGVTIKESPEWLKTRLRAIGLNPINNIVDITNFVLHETGQPLHAFDADIITGNKVIVKTLPEKTKFVTLDEIVHELSSEDLMICNAEKGMCIAGVFGGIHSGVTENTKNIFLECACFDPVYVRKTSKRHLLNTDSSFRFERGTDPNNTIYTLKRAAILIKEIAGGKISSKIVDVYNKPVKETEINLSYNNTDRLIGKNIEREKIKNILEWLDFKIIDDTKDGLKLLSPTYRVDVQREPDVIEEILRIYGYNNIEISDKVNSTLSYSQKPDPEILKNNISDLLSDNGFAEIMSNSLTKSAYYDNLESYKAENVVKILNPLSNDLDGLRQNLLFGGLEAIIYNINRKNSNLKLYEFGNCYSLIKNTDGKDILDKYYESQHLALFITGRKNESNWNSDKENSSFFYLKAYVDNILDRLGLKPDKMEKESGTSDLFSEFLKYKSKNKDVVQYGIINKKNLSIFDIKSEIFYADFNWDNIFELTKSIKIKFEPLPKFPEVKRDLALLLDKNINFEKIKELAFKTEKKLLQNVILFDVFEDETIGKDKKSYAISFILQDINKTLTDKQIDKIMNNFINIYKKELNAKIR
ncbi:MAG: phenylalanine--tRNA ligase subunit beta [Bacteroidales bacterium]|nr:phenylalanine--tRNA ligase subunit beta [Bacteroidales bacterium]